MRSIRFSVAASMAAIVAIAAVLAILRFPSPLLANALFSTVVLGLSLSLIGVVFARRLDRARWAGALIAGGIAFALHFVPWLEQRFGDLLATAAIADILFERFAAPAAEEDDGNASAAHPAVVRGGGRFVLARYVGRFGGGQGGGGKGGFGAPAIPPPSALETWTSVDRERGPMGFSGATRSVGRVTIARPAPAAMQRIVDCLAVLITAIIGASFARRCASGTEPRANDPAQP